MGRVAEVWDFLARSRPGKPLRGARLYYDALTQAFRYVKADGTDSAIGGGGAPSGAAGGDLGGTYPNPTVTQARGLKSATTTVSVSAATAPTEGQALTASSSTAAAWTTPKVDVGCDDIVSILASASTSWHYARDPDRPSVIRLNSPNNFPTARSIAAASPEYGWTWANRTVLTTADENTTTANAVYGDHDGTSTDWTAVGWTTPYRYQTISLDGRHLEVVGLFYSNGNANWESTGMLLARDSALGTHIKVTVGWNATAGAQRVTASQNGGTLVWATITTGQRDAGVWVRVVMTTWQVLVYYNVTASSDPPTGSWTLLTTYSLSASTHDLWRIGMIWQTVNTANHLTGGCKWFGWRSDAYQQGWPATLPSFQAQLRTTAGDALTLATVDFGRPVLPSQATMRLLLADAENRTPGDAASWTYSLTGSDSAGPAAATTYQAAAALNPKQPSSDTTETTARRYWTLRAKGASSSGTQTGSLDTALIRIVN